MDTFLKEFQPKADTTILDVGGYSGFWKNAGTSARIVILRPEGPEQLPADCPPNISSIQGDGCALSEHADKSFDIVFSNSVIEHVGGMERQREFAQEAMRVGRCLWIQTPAREFPIEPHLLTPFYHWFPRRFQERFFRWTVWGLLQSHRPTLAEYEEHTRAYMLSRSDMRALFPRATIVTERFLGWPKSYAACMSPFHKNVDPRI
jgi:hypothetical protein